MRAVLLVIAIASLSLAGCGKDSPPKAFPGSAADKARELIRREDAAGLPHGSVASTAFSYKTVGDGFCADDRPEFRNNTGFPDEPRLRARLILDANLVVDVYCPWLSHFHA
jgi:hypothetical protein